MGGRGEIVKVEGACVGNFDCKRGMSFSSGI